MAFAYEAKSGEIRLFVDGQPEPTRGKLQRKGVLKKPILRIGYTAANFPKTTFFQGEMPEVRYYNAC